MILRWFSVLQTSISNEPATGPRLLRSHAGRAHLCLALLAGLTAVVPAAEGRTRDAEAREQFRATHPCPTTGQLQGPCKGHVIRYIEPKACGGLVHPDNLQWQTLADARASRRIERAGCQRAPATGPRG